MKFCIITFRSVTFAQSAQRILKRVPIDSTLRRTPKGLEERGCGYCLQIRQQDAMKATELLRRDKREYGKLYVILADGKLEEMEV